MVQRHTYPPKKNCTARKRRQFTRSKTPEPKFFGPHQLCSLRNTSAHEVFVCAQKFQQRCQVKKKTRQKQTFWLQHLMCPDFWTKNSPFEAFGLDKHSPTASLPTTTCHGKTWVHGLVLGFLDFFSKKKTDFIAAQVSHASGDINGHLIHAFGFNCANCPESGNRYTPQYVSFFTAHRGNNFSIPCNLILLIPSIWLLRQNILNRRRSLFSRSRFAHHPKHHQIHLNRNSSITPTMLTQEHRCPEVFVCAQKFQQKCQVKKHDKKTDLLAST